MTDNPSPDEPTKNTTLLLVAAYSTWLLLVILVLWFVRMVGDAWKVPMVPLRHPLSSRMLLLGSILTVFIALQILGGISGGGMLALIIPFSNGIGSFIYVFILFLFFGYFAQAFFKSTAIVIQSGSFAPPDSRGNTALCWWAYGVCLLSLVFILVLSFWQDPSLIGAVCLSLFITWSVKFMSFSVSYHHLRWELVSNQQHASQQPQPHRTVAVRVECVAQWYYYDDVLRAFRGFIPQERRGGGRGGDRNKYHITNPNAAKIVLVRPNYWVELTPEDPDTFLDAVTQALNQDPEYNILPSIEGDEGSKTATVTTATATTTTTGQSQIAPV